MAGPRGVNPRVRPTRRKAAPPVSDLRHLAQPGQQIAVRVTPRAAANRIETRGGALRVYVTVAPEDGKANAAVQRLLAESMGLPKSRLSLLRGQTARDKAFVVL